MLKKILKWTLIVIAAIVILLAFSGWFLVNNSEKQLAKVYEVEPTPIFIPDDSASIAHGRVWAMVLCAHCHGTNLAGTHFFNEPTFGVVDSPNLTSGEGGIGGQYTDIDWIRAIKHGVKKSGQAAFVMPSADFNKLGDEDLGELIAYLKSIPPVDNQMQTVPDLTNLSKILISVGAFGDVFPAEVIDHQAPSFIPPQQGPSAEYGSYLVDVFGCRTCHGPKLNGGKDPDPTAPFAPNLTPGGNLANWSNEQFTNTMRTGMTPEGKALDLNYMPWTGLASMPDDDLTAVYLFLKSQPNLET
ncbi:MAG TPA: c-type cytochrome, partial [Bacteroidales bacterium]